MGRILARNSRELIDTPKINIEFVIIEFRGQTRSQDNWLWG